MKAARILAASALATGTVALASTAQAAPAASTADNAMVSILHGVPGATVDVYANGNRLLQNFKPGTLTDPVSLPGGSYDIKVTAAGAGADGDAIMEANDVNVPGGANATVVAHLTADGQPQLTPFVNDTSRVPAGKARITVRHTAAAPAVDVRANGDVAFRGLENPKEVNAELPAGSIEADVVLAGTDTVAIGPARVDLKEGTNTIVYAWGSAEDDNLALAVQVVGGMQSNPNGVPAGEGGQAAQESAVARTALVGTVALTAGGLVLLTTRRRETTKASERA